MKIKCSYCGSFISDTDELCPNCGAVNENLVRNAEGIPKTIDELLEYCNKNNLPLKDMRFFIGEDFKEPKAFGIYKDDDGNFVVYKNKADGTRAVRYTGKDEAYAVNELYRKMSSEISMRKQKIAAEKNASVNGQGNVKAKKKRRNFDWLTIFLVFFLIIAFAILYSAKTPTDGYYNYDDTYYYYNSGNWYYYDDYSGWSYDDSVDDELKTNYDEYSRGSEYSSDYGVDDFKSDSNEYWNDNSWDDNSWDSNDSWDYNDSDWDSDW